MGHIEHGIRNSDMGFMLQQEMYLHKIHKRVLIDSPYRLKICSNICKYNLCGTTYIKHDTCSLDVEALKEWTNKMADK